MLIVNHEMIYGSEIALLRNSSNFDVALEPKIFNELFSRDVLRRGNFIHPAKFTIQNNTSFRRSLNQQMRDFVIIQGFVIVFPL